MGSLVLALYHIVLVSSWSKILMNNVLIYRFFGIIVLSSLSRTFSKNDNCINIFRIKYMSSINPKKIYRPNGMSNFSVSAGVTVGVEKIDHRRWSNDVSNWLGQIKKFIFSYLVNWSDVIKPNSVILKSWVTMPY